MKNMPSKFKSNPLPMHRDFVSKQLMGTGINQHRKAKQVDEKLSFLRSQELLAVQSVVLGFSATED